MSQRAADSRRNSLTSISTTNSAISNIAMNPQQSASSVRALSTDQLISIDNKFVKKNAKKPTSENFYHKAQGTYYFPNGEVFRPRISPSRRHKPGKVQGKGGYHYVPQPGNPGAPSPRQYYQPIQPQVTHQSAQGHLSTSGPDSNVNGNIPRSYSSSNVKRLNSSKNLAQTLRSTKADLPTNVTLFQQHLQQQHQQHQPGHIPQQYSQQFQQFQQFQQHQQQQTHYPHTPDKHSPVLHHPPQFQSQSQSNIPIIPHPSPQAIQMQQFSQYQAATSNSSSSTSLRTLQSNNVVKGLVLLTDGTEKSLENNLKSDSNLSSISNYTLNRSTSNTPQTSVNNSVEDEKDRSDSSRPNSHSSVHQSDEEVKPLKDIEETKEIKFNEPEELRTPDAESCEVFSTPMGEKFETPQSSPTDENKPIDLTLNEIENPGSNNEVNTHQSNTSRASSVGETSIYSSDTSSLDAELQSVSLESLSLKSHQESSETQFGDAKSKSDEYVAAEDKTGSASEVEVAENAVETSAPSDLAEEVPEVSAEVPEVPKAPTEAPADITRDSSAIDTKSKDDVSELGRGINLEESLPSQVSVVEDGFTKSYESLSSHSSTDMSSLPSPKSLDNHSHEDVDDLINTYQAESPLSKKDFVDINNDKILDSLMNDSQSAPRRGDITVVNNTVRKHQRKSSSISSFNSILRSRDANENKQIDESMLSPTPSIKGELEDEVQNEDKEELEALKDEDILPKDTIQNEAKVTQPEESNSTKEIKDSSAYKPKSMLDVLDSEKSKPKSMLDVLGKQEEKKDKSIEESSKVIDIPLDIKYESPKKPLKEEPKTPTKPKKKAPSGSPLVDRAKGENVQDQKVLPSTPKTNRKEIKNVKSMSSLPNEKKSTRWKKMFNIKDGIMPTNRSASDSRTSFDVKSVASNKSGNQSITSAKFKLSKKTFSFRDLKISSFKNNHENAPPVPDVNMYLPEVVNPKPEAEDPFVDSEELTLTKLPSIESDDNMFDDVLLTFDEKLEVVGRKGTLLKKPTKITEPFLKDDELTRDQIEDQQIKDKLMNTHSRSNSDDYIDENLQFLKEELIWPIDNDVKSFKSAEEKLVRNIPTNDNDKTLGGEEDIFFIDNEQLNNLFNNINDSQRRKLPMHLKYIKQFKDYDMLEINIKKFEHLPTSSLDVTEKAANPILKRRTKYGTHSGVLSSKDRYKTPSMDKKGKVQFSSKISINETFSPDLYSRYNKSVTQYTLTEPSEINKIKNELNDYKCNEMLVHEQSQTNTHFFY